MAVEILASSVVARGGARVGMPCCDLDVAEVDADVEHGGGEGVAQYVRVHAGHPEAGPFGEMLKAAGGDVPSHAGSVTTEQDRAGESLAAGPVDGAADSWWQRGEDDLVAFAVHSQDTVTVDFTESFDVATGGLEDPQAKKAEHADERRALGLGESRPAIKSASNWRWDRPRVGDSGGTRGRRTCSAGDCASTPSMTAVR